MNLPNKMCSRIPCNDPKCPDHSRPKPTSPKAESADDPLKPAVTLLVKLGSLAVHADEMLSLKGHHYDKVAVQQLISDPEIRAWLAAMDKMALLPVKR